MKFNKTIAIGVIIVIIIVAAVIFMTKEPTQTIVTNTITFTKPVDTDTETYKDCITTNVCITRGSSQSIYNSVKEDNMSGSDSPLDTEWAKGSCDSPTTIFSNFVTMHSKNPQNILNEDLCLHLISDDIYIDIMITSWSSGGGGGFSYIRDKI
jgi:hypothetical protein